MKRLVVNAFYPGEHKVVSNHAANPDLSPRSPKLYPSPPADPRAPSVVSKRNEATFGHERVNLSAKRGRFRRPKVIVDHDPAAIVKQITVAIQIPAHVIVRIKNKQANLAAAQVLMNFGDDRVV